MSQGDQGLQIGGLGAGRLALGRRAIAEPGQAVPAQGGPVVGQGREVLVRQGRIVQGPADRGQGAAALFDLAEAGGVDALGRPVRVGEGDGLLQGFETGLAQQDGAGAVGRTLDRLLGRDAAFGHGGLGGVDVERARGQVVDVRSLEADHVGDQPVGGDQPLIGWCADRRLGVPAEGLQQLGDEPVGLSLVQAAGGLGRFDQGAGAGGEDVAPGQGGGGFRPQGLVLDQLQPQQGAEDPEGIARQGGRIDRAEGRRMDRHPGGRQIVVADRRHAHDGEGAGDGGQFIGRADADGAVTFFGQPRQFARGRQTVRRRRIGLQNPGVDLGHQGQKLAVLGHLGPVHGGQGGRETAANLIGVDEVGHEGLPGPFRRSLRLSAADA